MSSPSFFTLVVFSVTSTLMGLFLLRIAIRGKLISPNPHCRKCRFDLTGLNLIDPTPCPECGTTLRINTPAILIGLRKKRKLVLLVAILFLLTAATGLAWPKLSKLPSIQSINLYDHFPEALLTKLATTGDDSALQTLHDRLIPGEVSDQALQTLIDHAFKLQADESLPWDERWGDVLLYAILVDKISHSTRNKYFESMIVPVVHQHDRQRMSDDKFRTELVFYGKERGSCSSDWPYEMERARLFGSLDPAMFEAKLNYTIHIESHGNVILTGGSTTGTHGGWSPASSVVSTAAAQRILKPEHDVIDVSYQCKLSIVLGGDSLHEWSIERTSQTVRVHENVKYAEPVVDLQIVEKLVPSLYMGGFVIPDMIETVINEPSLQSTTINPSGIQSSEVSDIGLVGTLSVRNDDQEIVVAQMVSIPLNDPMLDGKLNPHPMNWTYKIQYGVLGYRLAEFYKDKAFWGSVWRNRKVDVVFRPDPSMLSQYPSISRYLDHAIIFRDVPIGLNTPKFFEEHQSWGWESRTSVRSEYVYGELLTDED
jgi:hypothetical protein